MSLADQPGEADAPRVAEPAGAGGLRITSSTEGAATVLTISGEVDMRTAPVLVEQVARHFSADGRRPLVFDLSAVDFFGSAGLAVLAEAQRKAMTHGSAVWVVAATRTVSRPLQITGLDTLLNVVDDLATALAAIG